MTPSIDHETGWRPPWWTLSDPTDWRDLLVDQEPERSTLDALEASANGDAGLAIFGRDGRVFRAPLHP